MLILIIKKKKNTIIYNLQMRDSISGNRPIFGIKTMTADDEEEGGDIPE